jgi:hypothetical protein
MKFEMKYQPEKGGDWPFRCMSITPPGNPVIWHAWYKRWEDWCAGTFKDGDWHRTGASVWFKNREDALMFMLRWS